MQSSPFQKYYFTFRCARGSFLVSPAYAGKTKVWYGVEDIASGSAPRACGAKAQAEQVRRFLNGITPAYAGEKGPSQVDVHRGCGITPAYAGEKNLCILRRVEIPGITPAYAGKSAYKNRLFLSGRDHPPRMRGKEGRIAIWACMTGITPAYAGKSNWQ